MCAIALILLSSCRVNVSVGSGDHLTGEEYPDAEKYKAGAFTYRADGIKAVEVYWRSGEVRITESEKTELSAAESGGELSEECAMHYLTDGGVLRIRFCASGAGIRIDPTDKHLSLEVPKGIELSVHTTSASVRADTLEQKSVFVSAHSGKTELGTVTSENVDLSSSSGSVRADEISAQTVRCSASSGSVTLGSVSSEKLDCTTSSGDILIGSIRAETVGVEAKSGDVELGFDAVPSAEVRTSSGNVDIALSKGGAQVSYTSDSGKLRTERSCERKGSLYVFGGGESSLAVETSSGNLQIK